MKALVTGGAGFIGSHLTHALVKKDFKVTVVDNLSMGKLSNLKDIMSKIHFYHKNVCDYKFMYKLLKKNKFDYIYYLAAVASVADSIKNPWYTHMVNQESVINTLECIRNNHLPIKRFLFTSSAAVYGNTSELPKHENSNIDPLSPYAIDKFSAERYVLSYHNLYGMPTVCTRFFNVYGPNQNPKSPYSGVLSILTDCLKNHKLFHLYGNGNQTRDFVYINDVIQAILLVSIESNDSTVYNVATGHEISLMRIMKIYQEIANTKLNYEKGKPRKGDIERSVADISRISKLGYRSNWSIKKGLSSYWKYEIK